jgi:hypothetical protein
VNACAADGDYIAVSETPAFAHNAAVDGSEARGFLGRFDVEPMLVRADADRDHAFHDAGHGHRGAFASDPERQLVRAGGALAERFAYA